MVGDTRLQSCIGKDVMGLIQHLQLRKLPKYFIKHKSGNLLVKPNHKIICVFVMRTLLSSILIIIGWPLTGHIGCVECCT